jgi:hypothetical protein
VRQDPVQLIENTSGRLLEVAAGLGRHDLARAAVEEAYVQLGLEIRNQAADRRLGQVQRLRGTAKMPVMSHGKEGAELAHRNIHVINVSPDKIKRFVLSVVSA